RTCSTTAAPCRECSGGTAGHVRAGGGHFLLVATGGSRPELRADNAFGPMDQVLPTCRQRSGPWTQMLRKERQRLRAGAIRTAAALRAGRHMKTALNGQSAFGAARSALGAARCALGGN